MDVTVVAEGEGAQETAAALAERLRVPLARGEPPRDGLLLVQTTRRLELREPGVAAPGPVAVEFKPGRGSSLLRRATLAGKTFAGKTQAVTIVDATAGLGQDAFALAEAGSPVVLVERSPLMGALLADGLARALANPACRKAAERMILHVADAFELLPRLAPVDVVYLDPMYPRSGREGGKSKEMRMLRELLGADEDAARLLPEARSAVLRRVVVKRPLRAPPLAGERPSGSLRGTTVRYDLYGPAPARAGGREGNDER
jgi:16S rRNA (guanine1516-N2)-methyltransferase